MIGRRAPQKSRNGCEQCKARKIKCDEKKPYCSACTRRKESCNFAAISPTPGRQRNSASSTALATPINTEISEALRLELLHHFMIETIPSIAPLPERRLVLRTAVVKLAFSFPFLMHGILAVSAQHMAHVKRDINKQLSEKELEDAALYTRTAVQCHDQAISGYRQEVANITEANSGALFAYAPLLMVFVISTVSQDILKVSPTPGPSLDVGVQTLQMDDTEDVSKIGNWMQILYGIRLVVEETNHWIRAEGSLSLLFPHLPETREVPEDIDLQLCRLEEFCKQTVDGDDASRLYEHVNEELRAAFAWSYLSVDKFNPSYVFGWPARIPHGFSNLVAMKRKEAMAVLATYSFLVYGLDDYWFARGIGKDMILKLERLLPEDERHWAWWVMERVDLSNEL